MAKRGPLPGRVNGPKPSALRRSRAPSFADDLLSSHKVLINALTGQVAHSTAGCSTRRLCLPAAGRRVGILNLPQGVALVTTRSGQTPPAPIFVLGFPGL